MTRQLDNMPEAQRSAVIQQMRRVYHDMWMRADDQRAPMPKPPEGQFAGPLTDMLRLYEQEFNRIQNLPTSERVAAMQRLADHLWNMVEDLDRHMPQQAVQPPQQVVPARRQAPARAHVYRVTMGHGPQTQVYTLTLPRPIEDYYREGVNRGQEALARRERVDGRSGIIPPSEANARTREAMLDSVLMHSVLNPAPPAMGHIPGITVHMEGPPNPQVLTFNGPHGPPEETRNFQVDRFRDQYVGRLDANGVYVARNDVTVVEPRPPGRRPRRRI
jgi:hypothetical protein